MEGENRQHAFPSPGRVAAFALFGLIALVVLYAAEALLLVFGGILFGILLRRVSMTVDQWIPLRYSAVLALLLVLVLGVVAALILLAGPSLIQQLSTLGDELNAAYRNIVERFSLPLESQDPRIWDRMFDDGRMISIFRTAFSTGLAFVVAILVVFFTGVYFAADTDRYRAGLLDLVPEKHRLKAARTFASVESCLWSWLLGRLASMTIIGIGTWIGLFLLGIPLALPLALITAALTFIPNIGPVLSVIPPTLLGLEQGLNTAVIVVVFYLILQVLESYVITPIIIQHAANVPPLLAISSQLIMGMLVGLAGVTFAVPLVVVIRVLLHAYYIDRDSGGAAADEGCSA